MVKIWVRTSTPSWRKPQTSTDPPPLNLSAVVQIAPASLDRFNQSVPLLKLSRCEATSPCCITGIFDTGYFSARRWPPIYPVGGYNGSESVPDKHLLVCPATPYCTDDVEYFSRRS
jgi:hypothetical protein